MNIKELEQLLENVKGGQTSINSALETLRSFPYTDLGFAKIDHHREMRTGYPEIVYCAGKTIEQIKGIFSLMDTKEKNIMGTRATPEMFEAVKSINPEAVYYDVAKIISIKKIQSTPPDSIIGILTAGTSDIPVAEEAAITAELLGNKTVRIYDAGVAGLHRLLNNLSEIRKCKVLVVVAGMEGALPSVVGGLVDKPVIAVPTSIGYGANFGGLSALLTMLNCCAAGVTVTNIDNGFGGGFSASIINNLS